MKKTKFLTCLAALTLLLAGCETAAENLDSDTTGTESGDTTTSDTGTTEGGDTGDGSGDGNTGTGEGGSRLGLLGEAFKLVGGANYTLTCYSTAVNTDDHMSYTGVVTEVGAISTSYTGSTTGMINDPDDGGFVEVTLDGDVLKASAAPDPTRSVQDYYISSNIDTALFEELDDGRFALKDEGFTSDVLGDLFPDKPFTGGLITPTQGTIFIEVEDDLSKVTYYYDSSFLGNYTVTLVVENLGTTVFPYDLTTQYVGVGSEEVNSWATYLTETQKTSADNILGADMDDILPFYVPEVGYQFNTMNGKINLYAQSAGYDLCEPWAELLVDFGYEEVTANNEYKLEGDTCDYTVTLNNYGGTSMFDLYLYPVEKPADEGGDDEIVSAILANATTLYTEITSTGLQSWEAINLEKVDYDDGFDGGEYFYLTEKDGEVYGTQQTVNWNNITTGLVAYDGGYQYKETFNTSSGALTDTSSEEYEYGLGDLLEDYIGALENASSVTGELTEDDDGYIVSATYTEGSGYWAEEYTYTYYADTELNLTSVNAITGDFDDDDENEWDGTIINIKPSTLGEVEAKVAEVGYESWPVVGFALAIYITYNGENQRAPEGSTLYYVEDGVAEALYDGSTLYRKFFDSGVTVGDHSYSIVLAADGTDVLTEGVTIYEGSFTITGAEDAYAHDVYIALEQPLANYLGGDEADEGDPVYDMLTALGEGNFTLKLHFTDDTTAYASSAEEVATDYTMSNDFDMTFYFTEDVLFMDEQLHNSVSQEDYVAYVNNVNGTVTKYTGSQSTSSQFTGLTASETTEGTWQTTVNSALKLVDYKDSGAFTKGEKDEDGIISYSIDQSVEGLMADIFTYVFESNSYYGLYLVGPNRAQKLFNDGRSDEYTLTSTYNTNTDEWYIGLETDGIVWNSSSLYWREHDLMEATLLNVGSTTIPEEYASMLS